MRDEAVTAMQKASDMGDKSKELYTVLGRAYTDKKDWAAAIAAYSKGDPNATDLFKIGQMNVLLGNVDRADSVYRAMVEKDSTSSDAKYALVELAKLRFRVKDYPGTLGILNRRIALDPNSDEAYYYAGLSYKELKQLPEAITALRQATVLAPTKADRHFWLGLVLATVDSIPEANAELMRSTEIDSTSKNAAIAFQQLGYRALLAKEWAHAAELLERSATVNDKDTHTLVWLAQGYQNAGNKAKAIENYRKVLALEPGNAEALKGLKSLGA
jgi:tetratricopeptide (TPR) repeat protein